jgi:hypothetical protein
LIRKTHAKKSVGAFKWRYNLQIQILKANLEVQNAHLPFQPVNPFNTPTTDTNFAVKTVHAGAEHANRYQYYLTADHCGASVERSESGQKPLSINPKNQRSTRRCQP